ncbi:MAG: hypothetical protein ACRD2H_13880 [Terriglobales bacterium]
MEMSEKVTEAAGGLWLAFSAKEKIVAVYVAVFAFTLIMGVSAERKRKREARELRDDIVDAVRAAIDVR